MPIVSLKMHTEQSYRNRIEVGAENEESSFICSEVESPRVCSKLSKNVEEQDQQQATQASSKWLVLVMALLNVLVNASLSYHSGVLNLALQNDLQVSGQKFTLQREFLLYNIR